MLFTRNNNNIRKALILGLAITLNSCSKDPEPEPISQTTVNQSSILPSSLNGRFINNAGCMNLTADEVRLEISSASNTNVIDGQIIINDQILLEGNFPLNFQLPVVKLDTLAFKGFNSLIFHANTFQGNFAKANIRIFTGGGAFKDFTLTSDNQNDDGLDLVVKQGNIDCESQNPVDSTFGEITFWLNYDPNCGPTIAVSLVGQGETYLDTITRYYFSPDFPTCGSSGCANFSIPTGNYSFTASCPGKNWGPSQVTVIQGICNKILLP